MGNVGKMESRVDGFVKVESTVEGPYRGAGMDEPRYRGSRLGSGEGSGNIGRRD